MKINFDNKVLIALSKAFDCMLLAFYWAVCSLPVVTLGASTTAVLSVLLDVDRETGNITVRFLRAFKSNFRLSTLVWLLLLGLGAVLALDIYVCGGELLPDAARGFLRGTTAVAGLAYALTVCLIFGILAKFRLSFGQAFYNVLVTVMRHLGWSLLMAVLGVGIVLSFAGLLVLGIIPAAALFSAQAAVLRRIFREYFPEDALEE